MAANSIYLGSKFFTNLVKNLSRFALFGFELANKDSEESTSSSSNNKIHDIFDDTIDRLDEILSDVKKSEESNSETENIEITAEEETDNLKKEVKPGFVYDPESTSSDFSDIKSENESNENNNFDFIQTGNGIVDRIVNDPIIREIDPNIKPEDISFNENLILVNIKRKESSELYRIDIGFDGNLYIQAPLNEPYNDYKYVVFPLNSEEGKKIITEENYKYDVANINESNVGNYMFRVEQTSL